MAAPSFPLFSHPTTHMALCDSHSLAPITGILSQWVPTPLVIDYLKFSQGLTPIAQIGTSIRSYRIDNALDFQIRLLLSRDFPFRDYGRADITNIGRL